MKRIRQFFLVLLTVLLAPQAAMAKYYGLKVAGVSVTSDNCDNITGEYIKRCSEDDNDYWVRYEPSTKTLTLHNIRIRRTGSGNRAIFNESCDGLTIVFDGDFYLDADDASPIRLNANTTMPMMLRPFALTPTPPSQTQKGYMAGTIIKAQTFGRETARPLPFPMVRNLSSQTSN